MGPETLKVNEVYNRKITLFRDLLECVTLERENLINLDIKALWDLMLKKQKIMEDIENTASRLRELINERDLYHHLPSEDRRHFMELSQKLLELKENIRTRVLENISFIRDSLAFFHDIISMFASSKDTDEPYSPGSKKMKNGPRHLYQNEA
ncbi:MAG: flagellar export chaperone FlgN [Deltaproteobacteria bacterium]|nr:flagellar export chaperone FlgN [Deltaproteobacteria bacterium]